MFFLSCVCYAFVLCVCTRLFLCALWSPAGKGLISWLSFVVSYCEFVTLPLVSWVRCGTWLYRFLIFAPLLTLYATLFRPYVHNVTRNCNPLRDQTCFSMHWFVRTLGWYLAGSVDRLYCIKSFCRFKTLEKFNICITYYLYNAAQKARIIRGFKK